jgi:DNA-binding GntR family transcriptional regulator
VHVTHEPPPFDLHLTREAFARWAELHGAATRAGTPRLGAADFDRLRAADADYVAALDEARVDDAIAADDAFHRVLLDAAGDPDLQVSVDLLLPRLRRMDLWIFTRKAFSPGENSHPAIIAALERGEGEEAARLVERSLTEAAEMLTAALPGGGR